MNGLCPRGINIFQIIKTESSRKLSNFNSHVGKLSAHKKCFHSSTFTDSTFIIDFFVCFHNLASLELEIRLGKRSTSLLKQGSWKNLKRYYKNELQSTVT